MRCPKCGYISFDHLAECRKCHKNLETVSSGLYGTAYNVQPPAFLNLHREEIEEDVEEMELAEEPSFGDDEYVDDELAILVEEEEAELEGDIGFAGDAQTNRQASANDEQEADGEIEIDFSQFEAADDPETNPFVAEEKFAEQEELEQFSMKIDMPEELSDISDLAPPGKNIDEDELSTEESLDDELAELSLDELNFDLGLDDLDKDQAGQDVHEEAMLALDEIDFSEPSTESSSETKKKASNTGMDLDLDFELDLGGLSIHKDV